MAKAIYYNIFAYRHGKPTLSLVRGLVERGVQIIYYGMLESRPWPVLPQRPAQ